MKCPFKTTTRPRLCSAYGAGLIQQHWQLLPKPDKYHQEGEKHDRLPLNPQLRKPGKRLLPVSGRGEGLMCSRERPGAGRGARGHSDSTIRVHVAEERRATPKTYWHRRPSHEAGHLPSYVAGCPLPSLTVLPGALPTPSAAHRRRPDPSDRTVPERLPRPTLRPAPHQSLDEWTRAGRAGRALGSAGAHPQWLRGRARLRVQLLPRQLRRRQRRRQAGPAALGRAHRQRPPHPRRSETPIGRGTSTPRAPIGCGYHLAPPPRPSPDWLTGGVVRTRGRGPARGAGPGRGGRAAAGAKPRWRWEGALLPVPG